MNSFYSLSIRPVLALLHIIKGSLVIITSFLLIGLLLRLLLLLLLRLTTTRVRRGWPGPRIIPTGIGLRRTSSIRSRPVLLVVLLTVSRIVIPSSCRASIVIIGKLGVTCVATCCLKWLAISVVGWIHGGLEKKSQIMTVHYFTTLERQIYRQSFLSFVIQHVDKLELK